MPKKTKASKDMDFEQAMQELESLVDKMESGELSLEDSLKHFEQGVKLTRQCQNSLKEAEDLDSTEIFIPPSIGNTKVFKYIIMYICYVYLY